MRSTVQLMLVAAFAAAMPCIHAQSTTYSAGDQTFLKESAQDNMAEVKMAELALRTSKDATVTTFATKVIADHKRMLEEAKAVAMKANVTLPGNPSMDGDAQYLKLQAMRGGAFDKSYIQTMVGDHHKDLEAARDEHEKTKNEDMRKLAARAQEVIASHTEMVERIAAKMGV